jgi:hypothetical protein
MQIGGFGVAARGGMRFGFGGRARGAMHKTVARRP